MNFVDREMELNLLDDLYQRQGAQFLILYGRRRIGKTRLVTHWLSRPGERHPSPDKPGTFLYWMATQTSATNQLRAFSQTLFQFLNPGAQIEPTFSYASWGAALDEVRRVSAQERLVLILDEFTYVMQADSQVPSLIQGAWDHQLKERSAVFLILTGSLAGMIQRHVLDYQLKNCVGSGLQSRRTSVRCPSCRSGLGVSGHKKPRLMLWQSTGGLETFCWGSANGVPARWDGT